MCYFNISDTLCAAPLLIDTQRSQWFVKRCHCCEVPIFVAGSCWYWLSGLCKEEEQEEESGLWRKQLRKELFNWHVFVNIVLLVWFNNSFNILYNLTFIINGELLIISLWYFDSMTDLLTFIWFDALFQQFVVRCCWLVVVFNSINQIHFMKSTELFISSK